MAVAFGQALLEPIGQFGAAVTLEADRDNAGAVVLHLLLQQGDTALASVVHPGAIAPVDAAIAGMVAQIAEQSPHQAAMQEVIRVGEC